MRGEEKGDKLFVDVFPEIKGIKNVSNLFSGSKIKSVNFYKKYSKVCINIYTDTLLPPTILNEAEEAVAKIVKVDCAHIFPQFDIPLTLKECINDYREGIIYFVSKEAAFSRPMLENSEWEVNDNQISIKLKTKASEILINKKCNIIIEEIIEKMFSHKVKVEFFDCVIDDDAIDRYMNRVLLEEKNLAKKTEAKNASKNNNEKQNNAIEIIKGKKFKDNIIIPIRDITQDTGRVAIKGDIINVEFKDIKNDRYIYRFDVTDYTGSITVKIFVGKKDLSHFGKKILEGRTIKVRGEIQYDKFEREIVLMASDIIKVQTNKKMDDAKVKRTELHMHTQMSAMDATTPVKDIIKRAALWGHKAVAITDHGVVQAYPEAYKTAKEKDIKVIYGMECYLLNDNVPVVFFPQNQSIDTEYVVVDIETTGLIPGEDRITEICAIKIRDGEIKEKFITFINPEMPIPSNIVKLTGISNEMVKDAPYIEAVIPEFLEFIDRAVLVAYNASFDMKFIKHFTTLCGEHVNNTYIDILQMCRKMFPHIERYRLGYLAKTFGFKVENAHRALGDASAAARIFLDCIKELKNKGIKNINDMQAHFDAEEDIKTFKPYHAVILAKNKIGLKNLYKIVSESHLKYFYKKPRVPKKLLMKYRDGLLLGTACEKGELYSAILNRKSDDEITKIIRFYDYLEIMPLMNNRFLIDGGVVKGVEELKKINKKIVRLGEKFKKPVVATCDTHFLEEKDEVFRRILMAGQGFSDADRQAPLFFRTTKEMIKEFEYLGEKKAYEVVVSNTNKISNLIEDISPILDGTHTPQIEGAADEIKQLAMIRAKEIYGDSLPGVVEQRLEKELYSIIHNGFSVMYLIAQKLVRKSLDDGYLVGSRGSVGSSLVAYLIGITEVNSLEPHYICEKCKYSSFFCDGSVECGFDLPERNCPECGTPLKKDGYGIPFETFLGFEGDKEPDIDLNFSSEYQAIAHKQTEELFGKGNVYRAGTISSIADKTAFGFVKGYIDDRGIVATNAEINRLVKGCTGIKRTTGQHPGGVMIIPKDREIYDFTPIQRPADDLKSNVITTHFDYNFLHGSILKLDILGHRVPTAIKMLEDITGIDATKIELGEEKTMGIFRSTDPLGITPEDIKSDVGTFGIPEFGTRFVIPMLIETRPSVFSELIKISGLSHGTDVWSGNAQKLIKEKECTLQDVISCRDDIMIYLIRKGVSPQSAFKIMESVRKGKGLSIEQENEMKENKVAKWYIDSCKKIKYMFPKAHAAAYVMMAFRIAWYKVYYPRAFYATFFTLNSEDFDATIMIASRDRIMNNIDEMERRLSALTAKENNTLSLLQLVGEMQARGIEFLPVHLYRSDASKFLIEDEGIRPPLTALPGLGENAAQNIMEARKIKVFLSVNDLTSRAKVSKTVIDILRKNGCLEGIPESSQISIFK